MKYITIGKELHRDYYHPINFVHNAKVKEELDEACFSLYIIAQGSGYIEYNNDRINFSSPVLLCMNENESNYIIKGSKLKMDAVYFHPRIINPIFDFQNIRTSNNFSNVQQQDLYLLTPFIQRNRGYPEIYQLEPETFIRVLELGEQINNELITQHDNAWPCRSRSYFLEMLILIIKLYDMKSELMFKNHKTELDTVIEVLNYLHNNYQRQIKLEEITLMFATNRTTLNRQFYRVTNLSVINYLINFRISIAASLLRDTRLPLSEIMERVGFNNSTHFWRTFKKYNAVSPKEYREQYCWMKPE